MFRRPKRASGGIFRKKTRQIDWDLTIKHSVHQYENFIKNPTVDCKMDNVDKIGEIRVLFTERVGNLAVGFCVVYLTWVTKRNSGLNALTQKHEQVFFFFSNWPRKLKVALGK